MRTMSKVTQDVVSAVSGTLLFTLMAIVCVEVVSRYIFGETHNWAVKITPWLAIWVGCIAAGVVLNSGSHIRIDALYSRFGRRGQYIATIISHLATLILAILLMWSGILSVNMMLETNVSVPTVFRVPYGLINLAVPIGFFLVAAFSISLLVKTIISGQGFEVATIEEDETAEQDETTTEETQQKPKKRSKN